MVIHINLYYMFPFHSIFKVGKIWNKRKKVLGWNVKYITFSFHGSFQNTFIIYVLSWCFMHQIYEWHIFYWSHHHPLYKWQNRRFKGLSNLTLILCFFLCVIWILVQFLSLSQNHTKFSVIIYPVNGCNRIKNNIYHVTCVYRNFDLIRMLITIESNLFIIYFILFYDYSYKSFNYFSLADFKMVLLDF